MNELKYPILLVHGFGFRDHKLLNYWGRIPKMLQSMGAKIYYGYQDGNGTIEDNAAFLVKRIEEILKESKAEKVNVIAHSKGGLDMRYAISNFGIGDKIASLTTMSTPHHGSKTLDHIPNWMLAIGAFFSNIGLKIMGDKHPHAYLCYKAFRESYMEEFNQRVEDNANVYYQSYAFVMQHDIFCWFTKLVVFLFEGENDGFVTPKSAMWGEFRGVIRSNSKRGISHCDEVDFRRRRFTKKGGNGIRDILEVYQSIYTTLLSKGF